MAGWLPLFSAQGPNGGAQVNQSNNDLFGGVLNALDTATQLGFNGTASPSQLNANRYPNTTLSVGQAVAMLPGIVDSQAGIGTQWLFRHTFAGPGVLFFGGDWSNVTVVSGSAVVTTSSGMVVTISGASTVRITFNWTTPPGSSFQFQFRAAAWVASSDKMILCRVSDEAAIDAGGYWTPEYIAKYTALNLRTIRTLPLEADVGSNTSLAKWSYRNLTSSVGWLNQSFPPGAWGGAISGTNTYTAASLPSDSSSSTWSNNETIQGKIANASTFVIPSITGAAAAPGTGYVRLTLSSTAALSNGSAYISDVSGTYEANGVKTISIVDGTHLDLTGIPFVHTYSSSSGVITQMSLTVTGKTGTKFIASQGASASVSVLAGHGTFVYNSLLDVVMWQYDGIQPNVPIEALISLCNSLNVNLWINYPTYADASFVASEIALVRDSNFKSYLNLYTEYSNEVWNPGNEATHYATNMANALNGISKDAFYSLKVRQFNETAATTWATTRSASTLVRVLAWQAFGGAGVPSFRLEGSELNSATNSALLAYAGSINYSTAGQRPIDWSDAGSYANYISGTFVGAQGYGSTTSDQIALLQTWATALNSSSSDPTTLAAIDNDLRQGTTTTKTISSVSTTTINSTANGFSNGQVGVFTNTGGTLYSGVSLNTPYYVVSAATNSFGVSLTFGGAAISLSGGSGTSSFGVMIDQNMMNISKVIYQNVGGNLLANAGWEAVAASYDSYRTGVGQAKLWIELYEGGLEARAPTAAECTTMGITVGGSAATASAALVAGLAAYKNSAYGSALALSILNQFMGRDGGQSWTFGLMTHSKTPSWFLVVNRSDGNSQWSLLQGLLDSTAYQTYSGVAAFH